MKIILKLMGGLGNQLFQLSYALKLLNFYKAEMIIVDLSYYDNHHLRMPEITKFKMKDLPIKFVRKYNSLNYIASTELFHILQALSKKIINKKLECLFPHLMHKGYFFTDCKICDEPANLNLNELYLWGYFQDTNALCSKKLIKHVIDSISYDSDDFKDKLKEASNPVAISIRCGEDYIKNGYPVVDGEYYSKAINFIESHKGKSTYYIFSDDLKNALSILPKDKKYIPIHNTSPIIDLLKMSCCNDFIISNSSFSWWGAYLSENIRDKMIIYPQRWDSYTMSV